MTLDRDISDSDLASFSGSLTRLPTQACQGCNEFCLDEELEELEEGSVLLYCADCLFKAQKASDDARDEAIYG